MKKIIAFILLLFGILRVGAQVTEKKYLLTNHEVSAGLSVINMIDPYLSPMVYSGIGARYATANSRYLNTENQKYVLNNKFNAVLGLMVNPAVTGSMNYIGFDYGVGVQYNYRYTQRLLFRGGVLWDAGFGFKMVPRNINNPYNFDLATNLNLNGLIAYDYPLRKRTLRLMLSLATPVLGCMFVPDAGASYYDMFQLGNDANTLHLSSLHNKRGLNRLFSVDIPFNRCVWRVGFGYNDLKYSANNLIFVNKEYNLMIGTRFDVATFAGKKNPVPRNFLSTYE